MSFLSTPSVGRATRANIYIARQLAISIHALRGEGDQSCPVMYRHISIFLSTPSVGRATV